MNTQGRPYDALYNLFIKITKLYYKRLYDLIEGTGVHRGQVSVLMALKQFNGLSQKELMEKLYIKAPSVTVTLKRMERDGFISRRHDETDQRVIRIYITKKGRDAALRVHESIEQVQSEIFGTFNDGDLMRMLNTFAAIADNLKKADGPR